jgi:hypothetical protein
MICWLVSSCHEAGAVSLVHASQHQLLISAGKKGELFSSSLSIKPRTIPTTERGLLQGTPPPSHPLYWQIP